MLKKILIIGLIFLFAGVTALSLLTLHEHNWSKIRTEYKNKYSSNDSDCLHKYRLWLEVPEHQRNEFPWDMDANLSLGTIEEVKQHQHERFIAEADNIIDIDADMYPVAKLLYGDDWQYKLKSYNRQRELIKVGFILAIFSSSIGAVMVLSSTTVLLIKYLLSKKVQAETCQETEDGKESVQSILNCHPYSSENTDDDFEKKDLLEDEPIKPKVQAENPKAADEKGLWSRSKTIEKKPEKNSREISNADNTVDGNGEVIHKTLNKLTEEVAAMRRYAGQQQGRLQNLREGYDWNIIRDFGLRVIRCVDNLENRIAELSCDDPAKSHLEEIKDELIFALESSGLERYEPDVNSEYRGHEKSAEAIKERQATNESGLKGKISGVLRCGYRYIIDDENYKVIRAAQVKLFG